MGVTIRTTEIRNLSAPRSIICDDDVLLIYVFAFIAMGAVQRFDLAYAESVSKAIVSIFEVNAGQVFVVTATWFVLKSRVDPVQLSNVDHMVIVLSAAWFISPDSRLTFVGATIVGLYLWLRRSDDARLRAAGQIFFGFAAYELWYKALFKIVSAPIIEREAAFTVWIGNLLGLAVRQTGAVIISSADNWAILIKEGCSTFNNAALASLIWFCLIKLDGVRISRRLTTALATGLFLITCLNVFRLLAMAESLGAYEFWHLGTGSAIYSTLALIAIVGPTLLAMRRAPR